jgi:hypothetical protein
MTDDADKFSLIDRQRNIIESPKGTGGAQVLFFLRFFTLSESEAHLRKAYLHLIAC